MTYVKKRLARIALTGAFVLSLAACGDTDEAAENTTSDNVTQSESESSDPESTADELSAELRASDAFNDSDFTSLTSVQQDCLISGVAARPALAESALAGVDPPDSEMGAYMRIFLECAPDMLREIMSDGDPESAEAFAMLSDEDLLCIVDSLAEEPALMIEALEGGDDTPFGLAVLECAPQAFAAEMAVELGITTEQAECLLDGNLAFMQTLLAADEDSAEDFFSFLEEMTTAFEDCGIEIEDMLDMSGGGAYNEEELAYYRSACEVGDMGACDELYWLSPGGSDDEEFGATCGGKTDGTEPGSCSYDSYDEVYNEEELAYYRSACETGDMGACDELYWYSPSGSDDEEFGATCGGTTDGSTPGSCSYDEDYIEEKLAYDRSACEAGDMYACDELYWYAPKGSDDEEFGATCGGKTDGTEPGSCWMTD